MFENKTLYSKLSILVSYLISQFVFTNVNIITVK